MAEWSMDVTLVDRNDLLLSWAIATRREGPPRLHGVSSPVLCEARGEIPRAYSAKPPVAVR